MAQRWPKRPASAAAEFAVDCHGGDRRFESDRGRHHPNLKPGSWTLRVVPRGLRWGHFGAIRAIKRPGGPLYPESAPS